MFSVVVVAVVVVVVVDVYVGGPQKPSNLSLGVASLTTTTTAAACFITPNYMELTGFKTQGKSRINDRGIKIQFSRLQNNLFQFFCSLNYFLIEKFNGFIIFLIYL